MSQLDSETIIKFRHRGQINDALKDNDLVVFYKHGDLHYRVRLFLFKSGILISAYSQNNSGGFKEFANIDQAFSIFTYIDSWYARRKGPLEK